MCGVILDFILNHVFFANLRISPPVFCESTAAFASLSTLQGLLCISLFRVNVSSICLLLQCVLCLQSKHFTPNIKEENNILIAFAVLTSHIW